MTTNDPDRQREYQRKYANKSNRRNTRTRWTDAEILTIMHPNGKSDIELSRELGRSMNAIQVKRHNIKKFGEHPNP